MIGCDLIEVARIERLTKTSHFLDKCFHQEERAYFSLFRSPYEIIAGHFAAKEALAKALGCGFGKDLDFYDFAIAHDTRGRPYICWKKELALLEQKLEQKSPERQSSPSSLLEQQLRAPLVWKGELLYCAISISHTKECAMAVATIL